MDDAFKNINTLVEDDMNEKKHVNILKTFLTEERLRLFWGKIFHYIVNKEII